MNNATGSNHRLAKLLVCILPILMCSLSMAQLVKPGERYARAYESYLDAQCPIAEDQIRHFVYFARDRQAIHNHSLLRFERFQGAQIMYPWALLEPSKGAYNFTIIQQDLDYLEAHGKKLFIQLQDATFSPRFRGVPKYLTAREYDGGSVQQQENGAHVGWVAKRWNKNVRQRFALLLDALGKAFDGKIEGINLQETAIGVSNELDNAFSPKVYVESIKANMLALKSAFPTSTVLQYANFMPGEWLPWDDEGYLKSIYEYGNEVGVGLGAPDLMVRRKGQLNHALAMMHESEFEVPLGVAVQDGNYIGVTGADFPPGSEPEEAKRDRRNIVPLLHAFAQGFLNVQYMFWVNQEPYFEDDVLPCLGATRPWEWVRGSDPSSPAGLTDNHRP